MRRLSRLSARFHARHPGRKWLAAACLAIAATGLTFAAHQMPAIGDGFSRFDDVCYDAFYRTRPIEDRTSGPIVIVAIDDRSLVQLSESGLAWPFPRDVWANIIHYLDQCGAKAIGFDLLFDTPSGYAPYVDDDNLLAHEVNNANTPVVMAMMATPDGRPGPFAPRVRKNKLHLAAVNLKADKTLRDYPATIQSQPTIAPMLAQIAGAPQRPWAADTFRMHYFGPHQSADGRRTYQYVSLAPVLAVAKSIGESGADPQIERQMGISPAMFKDKIVLIGAISAGTYDLRSTPLSDLFPGVESHATALDDLLHDRHVHIAGRPLILLVSFLASFAAAIVILLPRKTTVKLIGAMLAAAFLGAGLLAAFHTPTIHWVPVSSPVAALLISTIGAFAWSYYTEDRNRRLIIKAFSQHVSPAVVAEIAKDPARVRLAGLRQVMTVMFTDMEGFTALSERMANDEALTETLNFYFGQMSPLILQENGTLDKYIGDGIMCFWNAPIGQPDHAQSACRAALAMQQREREIRPELEKRGAGNCTTRIGINTGSMVVGDMGSNQRLNYTVLGDSVNLASRLESANRFYGSRVLLTEATAEVVKDRFIVRKLDLLRVKGKTRPIWVYELLGERGKAEDEPVLNRRAQLYESALTLYHEQKWAEADSALAAMLEEFPRDKPAGRLLARVQILSDQPPGESWDGVYTAEDK
jgi:adenylate cyclase